MKNNIMKQIFIIACSLIILTSCGGNNPVKDEIGNTIYYINPDEGPGHVKGEWGEYYIHDSIPFFGKMLYQNKNNIGHTQVLHQVNEIAANDSMLSYDGRTLTVCGVGFGINIWGGDIYMYSSTSVDDSRMQCVVEYLNGIYGERRNVSGYEYWDVSRHRYLRHRYIDLNQEGNGTELVFRVVVNWCGNARLHRLEGKYEKHMR